MVNDSVGVLFSVWLIATLLAHLPAFALIRRADRLGILPSWNFFAPRPGQYSYHVLVRYGYANGITTRWHEIATDEARRWYHAFWRPRRRITKAILDAASEIGEIVRTGDLGLLHTSLPYIFLGALAESQNKMQDSEWYQFCLLAHHSSDPKERFVSLLTSGLFRIPSRQ